MNCTVQNKAGILQWSIDSFGLGDSRDLPGYSRYQMVGNEAAGEAFLEIQNVQLSDDAMYVCQVSAMLGSPAIASSPAHLDVLVAPDAPVIDGFENNGAVSILPPDTVVLTCRSNNGKPAASIRWLQNGEPLNYEVPVYSVEEGDGKRQNAVSTLTLQPEKEHNGKIYTCVVEHTALMGTTLSTSVTLSVLFAPDPPEITGYTEGRIIRAGDEVVLTCTAEDGNPLADVTWWRNDELIDSSYSTDGNKAINPLVLTTTYIDDQAKFICRAKTRVIAVPMEATTTLTVNFGPEYVNITGSEKAINVGDEVTLTCSTARSNPAASITWFSGGLRIMTHEDVVTTDPNGGYITSQNVTVRLTDETDRIVYMCQATNSVLRNTVTATQSVSVQYPPEAPTISGYGGNDIAKAGNLLSMMCASFGGNPLATLVWKKNGVALEDGNYKTQGNTATSQLSIITEQSDNGAIYSCDASNPATPKPLSCNVTLVVHFPPASVSLRTIPEHTKEGQQAVIECVSASSNPASDVTWFRDGIEVIGEYNQTLAGIDGGEVTISHLKIAEVTADDGGKSFQCRATNPILDESTNDAVFLDVKYAPVFMSAGDQTLDTNEIIGDFRIEVSARANPNVITYVWFRNGQPIDIALNSKYTLATDSGTLIIHNITKDEAGKYMCQATNEEGIKNITNTVNVWFSPSIDTPDQQIVSMGKASPLICKAKANPMPAGFIHWSREGYNISKYKQIYTDGMSTLELTDITKSSAGPYVCHADNGIAPKATKIVQVIVQYAPKIQKSSEIEKVASTAGKNAILVCEAEGAPEVRFQWFRHGIEFDSSKDRHTIALYHKTYSVNYESRLTIVDINEAEDFGMYMCKASNDLGADSWNIRLERIDVPDAVRDLREVSTNEDSVTLMWKPGFNGGLPQSFEIRYNEMGAKNYLHLDVSPPNATVYTVTQLKDNTKYDFNIRAFNDRGRGPYGTNLIRVTTHVVHVGGIPFYVIIIVIFVFAACIILNIFLVFCYLRKRKRKKTAATVAKNTTIAAPRENIELYKPPAQPNNYTDPPGIGNYDDIQSYDSEYDRRSYDYPPRGPDGGSGFYNEGYHYGRSGPASYDSWDMEDPYHPGPLPPVPEDRYEVDDPTLSEEEEYAATLRRKQAELTRPRTPTPSSVPGSGIYTSLPRDIESDHDIGDAHFV
ncbi:nephrin-like [Glandiceps talaboti]